MTVPTWPVAPTTPTRSPRPVLFMAKRLTEARDGCRADGVFARHAVPDRAAHLAQSWRMVRRPQLIPWRAAGQLSERQASGDDVVRTTGWVFNNETGSELTLAQFVATGDSEVPAYLTVFGFRDAGHRPADDRRDRVRHRSDDLCVHPRVRIGRGVRPRCRVPGAHPRDRRTVRQGRSAPHDPRRRRTDAWICPPNSADVAFSYITLQHCDADDALDLTAEAVRVTRPGGKIALNYRARSGSDVFLLPLGAVARASFSIPGIGTWLSQRRTAGPARVGRRIGCIPIRSSDRSTRS